MERAPQPPPRSQPHGTHGQRARPHQTHTPNTFRLRITNLPGRFAAEALASANLLDHLILEHVHAQVFESLTHHKWTRGDGSLAYGFVEADDEHDGNDAINGIGRIVLDGIPLVAEWCTDSRPVLFRTSTRLTSNDCLGHSLY